MENATNKVSPSHEDYLEAIVMLGGTPSNPVRSVDVAEKLGVSKASVSKALMLLKSTNMLTQPHYGGITLTQAGYEYGQSILERHNVLSRFMISVLGIDPEVAEDEACQMEHAISDESFEKWLDYFKQIGM